MAVRIKIRLLMAAVIMQIIRKDLLHVPQTGEQSGTDDNYARWHVPVP